MRLVWLCLFALSLFANDFQVKVGVSIAPYAYIVEKIGGSFVEIKIIVPPNKNPYTYTPNSAQVKEIKDFKIYIASGALFERRWLERFVNINPALRVLNFAETPCHSAFCYSWLSVDAIKEQAEKIAHLLRIIDLKNAQNYKRNLEQFKQELDELKGQIQSVFADPLSGRMVIGDQRIWGDYVKEFGLDSYDLSTEQKFPRQYNIYCIPFEDLKAKNYANPKIIVDIFAKDWRGMMMELTQNIARNHNAK
ncbi:hypothetical protein BBW65_00375 [Helicobacter enhydrae]|uniref:ABC transporter substrate-binding protein n=1 Tax=Helicobacter enhydrae TaxID=222136 RepID=A0A1B1U3P2_9HELI|nr:zinc ABC transporter substrate-binding protein [Helicobacter enhydrae]ANV97368.1 hypothetical protein BBW65_00375 [Helicobacter enhydrae]